MGFDLGYELNLDDIQFKDIIRFVTKIDYSQTEDGCDLWVAGVNRGGYGTFGWKGRTISAHKWAYALYNGVVPPSLVVRHTCDIRNCVRDKHLILGTRLDNSKDCVSRGRQCKGEQRPTSILTEKDILEAVEGYKAGVSTYKLAKKYKISPRAIQSALRGEKWKHLDFGDFDYKTFASRVGEKHHSAKLTEEKVREVHRLWLLNIYNYREIGELVGVDKKTIGKIVNGKNWSYMNLIFDKNKRDNNVNLPN